jgi:AmiR/NasT family two-component response regulator
MSKKVYVIVNNDYRFIDVKATKDEADQLIKEHNEDLVYIDVTEVTYTIIEKEI